jgi:hypothetical protein
MDVKKPRVDIPAGAQLKKKIEGKKEAREKSNRSAVRHQQSASIAARLASFAAIEPIDRSDNRSACKLSLC